MVFFLCPQDFDGSVTGGDFPDRDCGFSSAADHDTAPTAVDAQTF